MRLIVMPNPSSLTLLAEKLETFADELIFDVRRGSINAKFAAHAAAAHVELPLRPNPRRAADLAALLQRERSVAAARRVAQPARHQLLEGRHDAALLAASTGPVRRVSSARPGLHGQRRSGRNAAGQLRRRGCAEHHQPLLRVRARRTQIDRPNPEFLTCDQLEANQQLLRVLHHLRWTVSIPHQRRGARGRLLSPHAGHPVRAQGSGHQLDHRREADRVAGDGRAAGSARARAGDGRTLHRMCRAGQRARRTRCTWKAHRRTG